MHSKNFQGRMGGIIGAGRNEGMRDRKKIDIIIPCFDEEDALPFFYEEITGVLSAMEVA